MLLQEMSILVGAVLSILLCAFHVKLYDLLQRSEEYAAINALSKKIIYTVNLALALLFLLFGVLSIVYVKELSLCRGLALGVCLLYSLFWLWRAIWQFFYFNTPTEEANKQNRIVGYFLEIVFVLLFVAYSVPVLMRFL